MHSVLKKIGQAKSKIQRRLRKAANGLPNRRNGPELGNENIEYDVSKRCKAISAGGLGVMIRLIRHVGIQGAIDDTLNLLKKHRPYTESDHVLNIALNILAGGKTLDDIGRLRKDEAMLDALGVRTLPDPTTAGDFLRRFDEPDIWSLMEAINEVRVKIWKQKEGLLDQVARIDADGSFVPTYGECKQGMDYNGHKKMWGYHALIVSLANTNESLYIINRSGNRPSSEGAPEVFDNAIAHCRNAGFKSMLLRGDTDFSCTAHLDRWDRDNIRFVFGYDAVKILKSRAQGLEESEYDVLVRMAERALAGEARAKQPRVKEEIISRRGYRNMRLVSEEVAEFAYQPVKARQSYRMVVVRKNLIEDDGQGVLFPKCKYFFYITNDRMMSKEEVVVESNQRCNQENLIAQLKGEVRALHCPVNTLEANWAYMVIASLAWNLKAWFALLLPNDDGVDERIKLEQDEEHNEVLRMEFRTFRNELMLIPAQIIRTGRKVVFRLLAWRERGYLLLRIINAV